MFCRYNCMLMRKLTDQWVRSQLLRFSLKFLKFTLTTMWLKKNIRVGLQAHLNDSVGKEHALVISNHRSDIDWLIGWILAQVATSHISEQLIQIFIVYWLPFLFWTCSALGMPWKYTCCDEKVIKVSSSELHHMYFSVSLTIYILLFSAKL